MFDKDIQHMKPHEIEWAIQRNREYWEARFNDPNEVRAGDPIIITETMARDMMRGGLYEEIPKHYYVHRKLEAVMPNQPQDYKPNRAERRRRYYKLKGIPHAK